MIGNSTYYIFYVDSDFYTRNLRDKDKYEMLSSNVCFSDIDFGKLERYFVQENLNI